MLEKEWESSDHGAIVEAPAPVLPAQAPKVAPPKTVRPFSEFSHAVSRALLISWGLFALVVVAAFAGKLDVLFNLGVVLTFGAVFFGVPLVLLRIKRQPPEPVKDYIDTPNGRMPQSHALLQVVMVPVILSVGMAVIGYIATHQ